MLSLEFQHMIWQHYLDDRKGRIVEVRVETRGRSRNGHLPTTRQTPQEYYIAPEDGKRCYIQPVSLYTDFIITPLICQ